MLKGVLIMPIITIEITPQEYAKKAEISKIFTDELSRITGISKEPIVVLFHELSPEYIAKEGKMLDEIIKDGKSE
jgi:phenylpyruvate tautomerase PptA (4-oxalocrotonate tautomerase family)